jgi:hypothetical protein
MEFKSNILATGTITGSNLSGTNTGDQDLSVYYTKTESDGRFVNVTGDTMTGTLTVPNLTIGSGNRIKFANNDYIRYDDANGNGRFHFDADGGTNNASVQAATFVGALSTTGISGSNYNITGVNQLSINDPGEGILFGGGANNVTLYAIDDSTDNKMNFAGASELQVSGSKVFHDGYHPNADAWTTARTITIGNTGKSVNGSANVSWSLSEIGATPLNDIRSLGVQSFTNGANPNITTAQVMDEIDSDGGFDSYSSVFKTSWSYAGNYNLTDAGRFTETAGSSWITWTDNSSDSTRGNITALAIAPNTGGSAGKVFIYNNQGGSYNPGWREVWTNTSDGSGSGLDADLLDGQHASAFQLALTNPVTGTGTTNYLSKFTGSTALGNSLVYDNGTNVGIGTTSPSSKLQVSGEAYVTGAFGQGVSIANKITNYGAEFRTSGASAQVFFGRSGNNIGSGAIGADASYVFRVWKPTDFSTPFVIEQGGNVGIGTTSPGSKLEVVGDTSSALLTLKSSNGGANDSFMRFYDESNGPSYSVGLDSSDEKFKIAFDYDGDSLTTGTKMTIDNSGRVGIGVTPTQKLEVDGNALADRFMLGSSVYTELFFGQMATTGLIRVGVGGGGSWAPVYASAFNVMSDYRLKSNVVTLGGAIDRIKQLNVYRFNWNDKLNEDKVDGFIAHELATVIPEAVTGEKDALHEDGTEDHQGVDQAKVVPLLTAALKEAIEKIEQLETRIQTLENNG